MRTVHEHSNCVKALILIKYIMYIVQVYYVDKLYFDYH